VKTTIVSHFRRFLTPVLAAGALPLGLILGCQSRWIYFPRPYAAGVVGDWKSQTHGQVIEFTTSQGRQQAYLQGNLQSPGNLWIVCGGNGTVALEWADWLQTHAPGGDAWLLVDYPGYGACEGSPNPARIRESLREVVPLAWRKLGWEGDPDSTRLRFFGHSLGAAVCLIAASEFGIQNGVLVAPFTSTMDMSRELLGIPLGPLVRHRFDNTALLAELASRGPGTVWILHGTKDEVIPVAMSRQLAADQPGVVRLIELPEGRHNTVHDTYQEVVAEALRSVAMQSTS
jgi:pimeloyl-ACP methyl ester carboxylesterase